MKKSNKIGNSVNLVSCTHEILPFFPGWKVVSSEFMGSPPRPLFLVSNSETTQNKTLTCQLRPFLIKESFLTDILKRTPDYQVELLSFLQWPWLAFLSKPYDNKVSAKINYIYNMVVYTNQERACIFLFIKTYPLRNNKKVRLPGMFCFFSFFQIFLFIYFISWTLKKKYIFSRLCLQSNGGFIYW